MGDILSNLFGGSTSGRRTRSKPRPERGQDLETEVSISFEQAISGAQDPPSVSTQALCATCHGTGARPGTTPKVCPRCEGRGIETQGQGMFSISQPCSRCGGSGTVIEDPARPATARGAVRTLKRYRVNIPPGVKEGSRIRLPGKGEAGPRGGPAGDLYVITHVAPSPIFKRKGEHVEVDVPLTIPEALRGAEVKVPTLTGSKTLRVRPGTTHGTVQRLRVRAHPSWATPTPGRHPLPLPARGTDKLTAEQSAAADALARSMNGHDPRARLFAGAAPQEQHESESVGEA